MGPDGGCRWEALRAVFPRASPVEVLLEGVVEVSMVGPYRGCVSLEGVVERKVQIKQSAEKLTYLSIMCGVAGAICYCFFNLRYGLTSGPCLRAPSK